MMDILPAVALIAAKIEQAQEASSEAEARKHLKEIRDITNRYLRGLKEDENVQMDHEQRDTP